jgi:creatinine amidohydrolase
MPAIRWDNLTWEEVRDLRARGMDMVILPTGSTEQHGPHLPLAVDTLLAERIALAVSERTGVPILPVLPYGCALGHTRFWPGTISLSPETLAAVIEEILEDVIAYGFTRILILSGHVTNAAPQRVALERLRSRHPRLQIAQRHLLEASARTRAAYLHDAEDFHANASETALMMLLAPDSVRRDRIFDDPDRTGDLVFSYAVPWTSQAGHTGRPTEATPEMGADLFEMLAADWTEIVQCALAEKPPIERNEHDRHS